ncbi:DUF4422 domain-containing protein [Emticicia sp. BO119]|uniref:DUF4422 domain-containing protein n=1 Tax=Emticicia sp. BO119 TaxID=2757768 RepID=UPI0015F0E4AF|nr:DUF4422 domain-containing protein [Emticicia sp. BO119]MBA4850524.1 DUF4422 domain-containing protein [Emticicia sp. BO119]
MKKVMIYIATHKPCVNYLYENGYHLLHSGAEKSSYKINEGFKDNSGDNISAMNPLFCELTGLYWMWKNGEECDYTGLVHYRRFLGRRRYALNIKKNILDEKQIINLLNKYDAILPNYVRRSNINGYFEDYSKIREQRSYVLIRNAIIKVCPNYISAFEAVFTSPKMFFGNIIITKKGILDKYAQWLFNLETQIVKDIENNNDIVQPRELGYLSEWMLNIYFKYHEEYNLIHKPIFFTEKKNNIIYILKILFERIGILS